jgi:hypothetical protein
MAGSIADVLAGSSLVMAILAAFFTLWQPAISDAANIKVAMDRANREPAKSLVEHVLRFKLLPLLLVSSVAFSILAPRAVGVIGKTAGCAIGPSSPKACFYDDVSALFLLTEMLLFCLVIALGYQLKAVWTKRAALRG